MPPTELGWYMKYVYQHEVVKLGVSSLCLLHLTDELNSENIRFREHRAFNLSFDSGFI